MAKNKRKKDAATTADEKRQAEQKTPKVPWWKEYGKAIGSALIIAAVLKMLLFQAFTIPTGSMLDTLQIGDFLFVEKVTYGARTPERVRFPGVRLFQKQVLPAFTLVKGLPTVKMPGFREPRQGDIIVFAYPRDKNLDYIKRCVAVEGDTVQVKEGVLYVNGDIYESNLGDYGGDHSCIPAWNDPDSCPLPATKRDYSALTANPRLKQWPWGGGLPYVVPEGHLFMMGDNRFNSADSRYWGPLDKKLVKGKAAIIYWSWDPRRGKVRWNRLLDLIH
ncbi:signal peptidase I [bacterium DOLZORAL124_64_63]|nr:MAG: signal peptidase I [bacterium DOLZORAL124_64_63]